MERSLSASIRQAYNTLKAYDGKAKIGEVECADCQGAFKEAKATYLAQDCVGDLESACKIIEKLLDDLQAEARTLRGKMDGRVGNLVSRIDNFRENHKNSACIGAQRCYWFKSPSTPFSSIRDEDL